MKMKRTVLLLLSVAALGTTIAQEKSPAETGSFKIDAQLRSRGEYRNGQGQLRQEGDQPSWFVNDRVRLSLGWERGPLSMKVAAQHAGVWGDAPQQNKSGNLSVHEAWARMNFAYGIFAQVGRQVLSYDDERLLGGLDWATTGRAHDALRLGWENRIHQVHAIVSFNQTGEEGAGANPNEYSVNTALYKNMQTLWYHYRGTWLPVQLSVLAMNVGIEEAGESNAVHYLQTAGLRATYERGGLSADASAYVQLGHDASGNKTKAGMASLNASYKVLPALTVGIGDDYLTGDDGTHEDNHTFNVLYGTHHKFYGAMDYFGYNTMPLYGLNDLNAKASYAFCKKLDASLAYHWFSTTRDINNYLNDGQGLLDPSFYETMRKYKGKYRYSRHLGHEIDLQVSYRPMRDVTLQAGYSVMLGTETMQLIKGGNRKSWQDWGWISLNVSPTLFSK